jgi:CubicO group peptidase (beta-lactamase class C family)
MLANGGKHLLSPVTVKPMSSVQIPYTLRAARPAKVWLERTRYSERGCGQHPDPDGSFGCSGAYGTHFWADPKQEIIAVMIIQTPIREMRPEFENVMQSIVK